MDMKKATLIAATLFFGLAAFATPRPAQAAFRLGVDGIWVPVSAERVESGDTKLDSSHKVASFGGAVHGNIGFDIFSIGLKLNYFNEGLELENEGVRRNQVDINAMGRVGIPATKFGIFAEAGGSLSTDFNGLGYNAGIGAEYSIVKTPLVSLNFGSEGQYVNLPADINGTKTDNKSFRLLVFLGADFGL